ncbi:MAG: aldehyde dehydrogenase family protein [Polyangiaceae bacterium]|nr:aldehyde dehydrogenase family protein [Polyangiaceae bacterium]
MTRHMLWIDGEWRVGTRTHTIKSPYGGRIIAVAEEADDPLMDRAIAAAKAAQVSFRRSSRHLRSRLLAAISQKIAERRNAFVLSIVDEAGKPSRLADLEVTRAIHTFTTGAEEAKRYGGEWIPIDVEASGRAYDAAQSFFVPRGPVLAITPFNFPLNLVAHKVAPALAVGAPVIVKSAPQTPGPARLLAEVFESAAKEVSDSRESIPLAALQTLTAPNEVTARAVKDLRIAVLTFTGSATVGWSLQAAARGKRVALELGGNAAVIVHSDADLARAAARVAFGAFAYAGQICISVQNVWVEESVESAFRTLLASEISRLVVGDPRDEAVIVGPLIDGRAADRVASWIDDAQKGGAEVVIPGRREGNLIAPTVLSRPPESSNIVREEVFGPVLNLFSYRDIGGAIAAVNRSRYGLQAGVFTDSIRVSRQVIEDLDVGGILINEIPTYRADHAPYGGVKDSGLGREGLRYAMEEYSERKTVISFRG